MPSVLHVNADGRPIFEDPSQEEPGVLGTALDVGGGIVGGVRDATQETVNFVYNSANWVDDLAGDHLMPEENPLQLPDWETNTAAGRFTRSVSQFVSGFVGAGKVIKALKLAGKLGKLGSFGKGAVQGGLADVVAFDPHEARLSNLIQEFPSTSNSITEFLSAGPDDSDALGRLKNALEGLMLGGAVESTLRAFKGYKKAQYLLKEGNYDEYISHQQRLGQEITEVQKQQVPRPAEADPELDLDLLVKEGDPDVKYFEDVRTPELVELPETPRPPETKEILAALQKQIAEGVNPEDWNLENQFFNMAKRSSPEKTKQIFTKLTDEMPKSLFDKPVSFDTYRKVTQDLLDAVGPNTDLVVDIAEQSAEAVNKAVYHNGLVRSYLDAEARVFDELLTSNFFKTGDPATESLILAKLEDMVRLTIPAKQLQRGYGRGLAFMRDQITGHIRKLNTEQLEEYIVSAGGRKQFDRFMTQLRGVKGNTRALYKLVRMSVKENKFINVANEIYINNLLSGFTTQAVNATSNAIKAVVTPIEMVLGGIIKNDPAVVREGGQIFLGYRRFFIDALRGAKAAMQLGDNVFDPMMKAYEGPQFAISAKNFDKEGTGIGTLLDAFGSIIRWPGRLLMSTDEFFKQIAGRSKLYSKLYTKAYDKFGPDPDRIAEFIERQFDMAIEGSGAGIHKQGRMMAKEALSFSREQTWTQHLEEGLGRSLMDFSTAHPMAKLVVPFVRTPTNIIRDVWAHSPLVGKKMRQMKYDLDISKHGDATRVASAVGKMAVGKIFYIAAAFAVASGNLTGAGPRDAHKRSMKYEAGWQPYSLKIGDKYLSYKRFEPFGTFLGFIADFSEMITHSKEAESVLAEIPGMLVTILASNIHDKTYLRGMIDFASLLSEPERRGARYIERFLSTILVPSSAFLRQSKQLIDPTIREVDGVLQSIRNTIPGLSSNLPARKSWVTGEDLKYKPWLVNTDSEDTVMKGLADLDYGFHPPTKQIMGVDLEPQEYERLLEIHGSHEIGGKTLKTSLGELFEHPEYMKAQASKDDTQGTKLHLVKKVIGAYRNEAKSRLVDENPGLIERLKAALSQKRSP